MRTITDHVVDGDSANHQIDVYVLDAPGAGGANHRYELRGIDWAKNVSAHPREGFDVAHVILFQNGPIKESGVNGVTQEALLAIVLDRLKSFQSGPFACQANAEAAHHVSEALTWLQKRTRERIARGVEGTHTA